MRVPCSPHPLEHLFFADFWWWPFWPGWGHSSLQVWSAFPGSSFEDRVPIFLELGTHCRDSYTWSFLLPSGMFLTWWREFTGPWWWCLIPGGPYKQFQSPLSSNQVNQIPWMNQILWINQIPWPAAPWDGHTDHLRHNPQASFLWCNIVFFRKHSWDMSSDLKLALRVYLSFTLQNRPLPLFSSVEMMQVLYLCIREGRSDGSSSLDMGSWFLTQVTTLPLWIPSSTLLAPWTR